MPQCPVSRTRISRAPSCFASRDAVREFRWAEPKRFESRHPIARLLDSANGVPPDRAGDAFWYPLWGIGHRCPRVWDEIVLLQGTLLSCYFRGDPKIRYQDGPRPIPPRLAISISPAFCNRLIERRTVRSSAATRAAICFSEILASPSGLVSR